MTLKAARIFRSSKRTFDCKVEGQDELVVATAMATLLKEDHLVVGDFVQLAPPQNAAHEWSIQKVEPRKNSIFRNLAREQKKKVIAANVDVIVVVVSAGKPEYKRGLVDRYLTRSSYWGVPAVVVFNKMDLYQGEFDLAFEADRLKALGVRCFEVSSETPSRKPQFISEGYAELESILQQRTAIMVGHSGVGKSRLINSLSHGKFELLSGDLGRANKGAHTTTWAELIDTGAFTLIDSPGIRSMSLDDMTTEELKECFPDIEQWGTKCKFSTCQHFEGTKGCFFGTLDSNQREDQLILSRLESYHRILSEVSNTPDWMKKST